MARALEKELERTKKTILTKEEKEILLASSNDEKYPSNNRVRPPEEFSIFLNEGYELLKKNNPELLKI